MLCISHREYSIPIRSEQFLASLQAKTGVSRTDDGITERDLVLTGYFSHNLLQVIILNLLRTLPRDEVSVLSVVAIYTGEEQISMGGRLTAWGRTDRWRATS